MHTQHDGKILDRSISRIPDDRSLCFTREGEQAGTRWAGTAALLRTLAEKVEQLPDNEAAADEADTHLNALLVLVATITQAPPTAPPAGDATIESDLVLFRRLYPRVSREQAIRSQEFRQFRATVRPAASPPPPVREARPSKGIDALLNIGVDPVSASRISDQLGEATTLSIAGWVRGQGARSPSGLLLSVARKRGYTG